ncbi:hypothetical protein ABVF33_06540 [Candidatus Rickettsia barbariae]
MKIKNAHASTFNCKPKAFNKDPILSTLGLLLLDNIIYICMLPIYMSFFRDFCLPPLAIMASFKIAIIAHYYDPRNTALTLH